MDFVTIEQFRILSSMCEFVTLESDFTWHVFNYSNSRYVQEGSVRGVETLLEAGAEVNTQDVAGHTPLGLAVKHKKRKVSIL